MVEFLDLAILPALRWEGIEAGLQAMALDSGFLSESGIPVVNKALPTTFVASCGFEHTLNFSEGRLPPTPGCLVQDCIRFQDRIGVGRTQNHLAAFRMVGFFAATESGLSPATTAVRSLLSIVDEERVWATFSAGCSIEGADLPCDLPAARVLEEAGLRTSQSVFLPEPANVWQPRRLTGLGGRAVELFAEMSTKRCSDTCLPGCHCGRFLEFGTIVQTEVLAGVRQERGLLQVAIGLERLAAVLMVRSVASLASFQEVACIVSEATGLGTPDSLAMIDRMRAVCLAVRDGEVPRGRSRGFVLRRLIREMLLGIDGTRPLEVWRRLPTLEVLRGLLAHSPGINDLLAKVISLLESELGHFLAMSRGVTRQ